MLLIQLIELFFVKVLFQSTICSHVATRQIYRIYEPIVHWNKRQTFCVQSAVLVNQ